MKYVLTVFAAVIMLLISGVSAAQEGILPAPRAENPPFIIPFPSNNNMQSAYSLYFNTSLEFEQVEFANTEMGEPAHACASPSATVGSHSIWLATHVQKGKINLDTTGSVYQTGSGPSSDTVMSVYRLIGAPEMVTFAHLQPVACSSNGSDAAKINKLSVPTGTYLIQISLESGVPALGGSKVRLKATTKPKEAISGDDINDPRNLLLPFAKTMYSLAWATAALDEPVDALIPPVQLRSSLWYRLVLRQEMIILFPPIDITRLVVSLFKVEANGTLTSTALPTLMGSFLTEGGLPAGEYLIRFGMPALQLQIPALRNVQIGIEPYYIMQALTPANADLGINEGTANAAGSLDGWKVKNATPSGQPYADELVCGYIPDRCGFQLTSSGAGEKTKLVGKVKLSNVRIRKGEVIFIMTIGKTYGNGEIRTTLQLKDAAGKTIKMSVQDFPGLVSGYSSSVIAPAGIRAVQGKVTIKLLSKTPGDAAMIDAFLAIAMRTAEPARAK